jgi:hypothetical protein
VVVSLTLWLAPSDFFLTSLVTSRAWPRGPGGRARWPFARCQLATSWRRVPCAGLLGVADRAAGRRNRGAPAPEGAGEPAPPPVTPFS